MRNPRFASFARPRNLDVQEAYIAKTGSVLLDVELTVESRLEFEALMLSGPAPGGSWDWTTMATSSTLTLSFEVIQHDPENEPMLFAARLTGWEPVAEPWPFPSVGLIPPGLQPPGSA
jgi:hypothetical protein